MRRQTSIALAWAVPICAALVLNWSARALLRKANANRNECGACVLAEESLRPYLAAIRDYKMAKGRLLTMPPGGAPEVRPGVPPAERTTSRDDPCDGWVAVRERYSWRSLEKGKAFAALEAFTSADAGRWRMASLFIEALPDGGNVSLAVTLETAEPAAGPE